jgi:hypothetical protein
MVAPIPSHTQSITDPGLANLPEDTSEDTAHIGISSLGTANTIYAFRGPDTQVVRDTLGVGPLVEYGVTHLINSGGKTVYLMPGTATAGSNSSVTASGAGPTVTLTGTPLDDHQAIVLIVTGGAVATATFKYSLDGGDTYSEVIATAATYLIPESGTTVNFAAGTYVAADTYSWTGTGPTLSNTNFGVAMDALLADPRTWGYVHLIGQGADAAATLVLATTMATKLATAETSYRYAFGVIEASAVTAALLVAAFVSASMKRVMVCAGFHEISSPITSRIVKRSSAWSICPRLAKVPMSVDASRNETDSDLEALPGVVELVPSGAAASTGYHDEGVTPGLNAGRFACLMTHVGLAGFYICNPNLMAPAGSDFDLVQYRRVMDRACTVNRAAMMRYLSKRLETKTDGTGYITEGEALAMEADINGRLRAALTEPRHAIAVNSTTNRADDLQTTPTLRNKVRVVPHAYGKTLVTEIAFSASV